MTYIIDSMFLSPQTRSLHSNGDRHGARPSEVRWTHLSNLTKEIEAQPVWFTDGNTWQAEAARRFGCTTVGLLLEPPQLHPENYEEARRMVEAGYLDRLFTSHPEEFPPDRRVTAYPHGGTRIHSSDWRPHAKLPQLPASIVASPKATLTGHRLRHEVIALAREREVRLDAFGQDYLPLPRKLDALAPYRFSVVIENVRTGLWFTEALLDAFLTFTVPIWWGSGDALVRWGFNPDGLIRCWDAESILDAVATVSAIGATSLYGDRMAAMEHNFVRAHEYTCTEDWLYRFDSSLFR